MSLWLHVRCLRSCTASIFAVGIMTIFAHDWYLPLPNLFGGPSLVVPVVLLAPIATAIAVSHGLTKGDPLIEAVASRRLRALDTSYTLVMAALALAIGALAQSMGGADLALAAGRNALGYIGLALLGRHMLGSHAAPLLPAGFAVAASLFGSQIDRQPRWWAWPIAAVDKPMAWSMVVILLALGAAVVLVRYDE